MLSIAERHKYILESLAKNGFVRVTDIAAELNVTHVTIRKDLKQLETKNLLYRTHGSALPVNPVASDIAVNEKEKVNISEKRAIAKAAVQLIHDNDSIIIGSGSTATLFAEELAASSHTLIAITSSLKTAIILNENPNIEVMQIGGVIRKNSISVSGDYAKHFFDSITCSKLFIGVDGISVEHGMTNSNMEEVDLSRRMMEAALKCIVLSDSTKFGKRGFGRFCNLEDVDTIITDSAIAPQVASEIEEMGVQLITV